MLKLMETGRHGQLGPLAANHVMVREADLVNATTQIQPTVGRLV